MTTSSRPLTLIVIPENIPAELRCVDQHVTWQWERRNGKWTKPPSDPKLTHYYDGGSGRRRASVDDPTTWGSFEQALEAYRESNRIDWSAFSAADAGIGIVLTPELGIIGGDLDKCVDPTTGTIADWAAAIVVRVNTYTEITPSGTGLRFFAYGRLPEGGRRRGHVELYDTLRFLTLTGHHLQGTPTTIEERSDVLAELHAELFPAVAAETPRAYTPIPEGDRELIERARNAKDGEKFRALHDHGDVSAYQSESEARWGYLGLAYYWTQGNAGRMKAWALQSNMPQQKWAARRGTAALLDYEIARRAALGGPTYDPHHYGPPTPPILDFDGTVTADEQAPEPEPEKGVIHTFTDAPCADQVAALQARITELEATIEAKDDRIGKLESALDIIGDELREVREEWTLERRVMRARAGTPAVRWAATVAIELIDASVRNGTGDDGFVEDVWRARLAREANVSKPIAGKAMALLSEAGATIEHGLTVADKVTREPRSNFRQKPCGSRTAMLMRLAAKAERDAAVYVDGRGRKPATVNNISACPKGEQHPIDAVCRVDGTIVATDLVTTPPETGKNVVTVNQRDRGKNIYTPAGQPPPSVAINGHGRGEPLPLWGGRSTFRLEPGCGEQHYRCPACRGLSHRHADDGTPRCQRCTPVPRAAGLALVGGAE
jgi:putative DNA primase/helicase